MKLLIQSDDYGMTRGVARGIVHGIENGILKNTGLFVNMPWSQECIAWVKPYLKEIALGIDLNITTGPPVLPPQEIQTLVKKNGAFYSSGESRAMDTEENGHEHASTEDLYREFEAQIQRFIASVGKKPDYIHAHAYTTPRIIQVQRELAKGYGIPFTSDVWKKIAGVGILDHRINWYKKPPTLENQRDSLLKHYILDNSTRLLQQDYCLIVGHMGYVDRELMELSSYTLYRLNDLDAVTSPDILDWVNDHHVELITYRDFAPC